MRGVSDQSWSRRGLSLVWGAEILSRIARPHQVVSVRQLFALSRAWPEDLPAVDGNAVVVAGVDGCLDALSPEDAAQWLEPRGGPFAGEAGAGVRQDGARGDLSGRFERGARGGRGGARGGHHHLLRGAAVPRAPSASRADADHGGGGEVGGGGAAGAAVERLRD